MLGMLARAITRIRSAHAARIVFMSVPSRWYEQAHWELDSAFEGIVVGMTLVGSCTPLLLQQAEINFTWPAECRLVKIAHIAWLLQFKFDDSRLFEDCPLALGSRWLARGETCISPPRCLSASRLEDRALPAAGAGARAYVALHRRRNPPPVTAMSSLLSASFPV
jgi:hypothetical protein